MNTTEFFLRFKKLLETIQSQNELENKHDAFIFWYAKYYLGIEQTEISERIVKDTKAEGIDAVFVDSINFKLYFIQAKTVESIEQSVKHLPENDIKITTSGMEYLLKGDYKGKITPDLENLIDEYHDLDRTGDYQTVVIMIYLKQDPNDLKYVDDFKNKNDGIDFKLVNIQEIIGIYENEYLLYRNPPPKKVTFETESIPHKKSGPVLSYVFTVKGKELAKTYGEHKESIFQQNIRNPIGIKGAINTAIYKTAIDAEQAKNFWYFNNGINIICNQISLSKSEKNITLSQAQIINGAQTTHALYEAYINGKLDDSVELLVKVIESSNINFIEEVTLYSNAQNAIRLRDLTSNDEIQETIRKVIHDQYTSFYQKKRGEFDLLYPTIETKKKNFGKHYKEKIIDNEKAGLSFLATFLDNPVASKKDKWMIFLKSESGLYNEIFKEKDALLPEKIYYSWLLMSFIESQKKEYRKRYNAEKKKVNPSSKVISDYFITQADYFIANLLHIYFEKSNKMDSSQKISANLELIKAKSKGLVSEYAKIINTIRSVIKSQKDQEGFYISKFFKIQSNINEIKDKIKLIK